MTEFDKQLLQNVKPYIPCFKNIFNTCLNVKDEKVLILGDSGFDGRNVSRFITTGYASAAKELKLDYDVVMQSAREKGQAAEHNVIYSLADLPRGSIILTNMSGGIGGLRYLGKSFRNFARSRMHRFLSSKTWGNMTNEKLEYALNALNIDYLDLQRRCDIIKKQIDPGKMINVKTDAGTDLNVNIYGKKGINNHGIYHDLGTGGNVPAGEVYLPPRARKKNFGKVVIDGSLSTIEGTLLIKDPVTLIIENSEIVDIKGGDEAAALQRSIDWAVKNGEFSWGVKRLCEFGIGCNPGAKLTGAMIVDEKVSGTAHIAQGSNAWFGGTIFSIVHLDHVFKNPKIFIDEEPLKLK